MLGGPWIDGTSAPLPCFFTSALHFQVLDMTVSNQGWGDLKARGFYLSLHHSERQKPKKQGRKQRQKEASPPSLCAASGRFHLQLVPSSVVGFLGTNSKWFVSTSRSETKYLTCDQPDAKLTLVIQPPLSTRRAGATNGNASHPQSCLQYPLLSPPCCNSEHSRSSLAIYQWSIQGPNCLNCNVQHSIEAGLTDSTKGRTPSLSSSMKTIVLCLQ